MFKGQNNKLYEKIGNNKKKEHHSNNKLSIEASNIVENLNKSTLQDVKLYNKSNKKIINTKKINTTNKTKKYFINPINKKLKNYSNVDFITISDPTIKKIINKERKYSGDVYKIENGDRKFYINSSPSLGLFPLFSPIQP